MKTMIVRIITLAGQVIECTISYDNEIDDNGFTTFCKVVKADGMFMNRGMCIPWHSIHIIDRPQSVGQQIALAQTPVPSDAKPN